MARKQVKVELHSIALLLSALATVASATRAVRGGTHHANLEGNSGKTIKHESADFESGQFCACFILLYFLLPHLFLLSFGPGYAYPGHPILDLTLFLRDSFTTG